MPRFDISLFDRFTAEYERNRDSVSSRLELTVSPQRLATAIGVGRLVVGTSFLIAPTVSVRILGVDTATAKRMRFLARMTAARDIGLGAGTLAAGSGPAAVSWLVAGAAADIVDGVAIATAMRSGVTRGVIAAAVAAGAVSTGVVSIWAARRLHS